MQWHFCFHFSCSRSTSSSCRWPFVPISLRLSAPAVDVSDVFLYTRWLLCPACHFLICCFSQVWMSASVSCPSLRCYFFLTSSPCPHTHTPDDTFSINAAGDLRCRMIHLSSFQLLRSKARRTVGLCTRWLSGNVVQSCWHECWDKR